MCICLVLLPCLALGQQARCPLPPILPSLLQNSLSFIFPFLALLASPSAAPQFVPSPCRSFLILHAPGLHVLFSSAACPLHLLDASYSLRDCVFKHSVLFVAVSSPKPHGRRCSWSLQDPGPMEWDPRRRCQPSRPSVLISRADVRWLRRRRVRRQTWSWWENWHRHCKSCSWRSRWRRSPTVRHTLLLNHIADKKRKQIEGDEKNRLCKLKGVV